MPHIYAEFTRILQWWRRAKVWRTVGLFSVQHRHHLIVKSLLKMFDTSSWDDDRFSVLVSDFTSVPEISNVWRSTGATAIKDTARRLRDDEVVSQCFSHMLGRCLRGRRLSIDGVESIILGGIQYSGAVFTEIFGGKEMRTSQPSKDLWTEVDDAWTTLHATGRRNSASQATSNLFLATVVISRGAKAPLARFVMWVKK